MRVLALCLALLMGGCAIDLQEPDAQLATQYAIMKWIGAADDPVVRAHRVLAIAEAMEAEPAVVVPDELRTAVAERVKGFDPADQMLAMALIDRLLPYVDSRDQVPIALPELGMLLRRAAWYYL